MIRRSVRGLALIIAIMACAVIAAAEDRVYTIEDAYRSALDTHEYVKIAEEGVVQSDSKYDQAWSYVYPRIEGQAAYTRYNDTLPAGGDTFIFQPTGLFWAGLILTQPLYTGGRTMAGLRMTEKMQNESKSNLSQARQDILLKVAEAYYGVLKSQKAIEISRDSLTRMERHKQVTEREATTRKTKMNASTLLRANTLVSQARINLVRSENGLRVSRDKLNLLTKLPTDALLAEPQAQELPSEGLDRLKEIALKQRDDYVAAKLKQSIAAENVTIVKGGHYPQVYAEAGLTYQNSHPSMVTDATTYYGGLRLQIPFFEGGLMKAEVSDARSKERQAELSTGYLRKSIESEVHEAYVDLQTLTSIMENAKLQVKYARENFIAIEGLYKEGMAISLSLIDAEHSLSLSERELAGATYEQQVAILRLRKTIGMLGVEYQ